MLKVIALQPGITPTWPSEPDPASQYYWRREADLYADGLPAGTPFRLPHCVQFARRDGSIALWLEDRGEPDGSWPVRAFGEVAVRLAQMPEIEDPPPWLARTWLRRYLELRAAHVDEDLAVWRRREDILERLDAAPRVLVHNDFHPGNIFAPHDPTVIDWAFGGLGPPGADAGELAADSLYDGFARVEDADALIAAVWDAYASSLVPELLDDAEFAFFAGTALRYAWTASWSERFAAVHAAVTRALRARLPSFA